MNLTPRQLDLLVAVKNYRHLHGIAPTFQELADELGVSKVTIFGHVDALVKKGALRRDRFKCRSLEVVDDDAMPETSHSTILPLLGVITSGSPIQPMEYRDNVNLEEMFKCRSGVYAMRVRGFSLNNDQLDDGDFVIIERRENPRNGERVIAMLNGGTIMLKRFYKQGIDVLLQPTNPIDLPTILPPQCVKILGVVIGMIREKRAA